MPWLELIGALPSGEAQPTGVAVTSDGDVLLVGLDTLSVWQHDGSDWTASIEDLPRNETHPYGLDVASNGDVLLTGWDTQQVWRYDGSAWTAEPGTFLEDHPTDSLRTYRFDEDTSAWVAQTVALPDDDTEPWGLAYWPDGGLLLGDRDTDAVYRHDGTRWSTLIGSLPTGEADPYVLKVTPTRDILLIGRDTGAIWRYPEAQDFVGGRTRAALTHDAVTLTVERPTANNWGGRIAPRLTHEPVVLSATTRLAHIAGRVAPRLTHESIRLRSLAELTQKFLIPASFGIIFRSANFPLLVWEGFSGDQYVVDPILTLNQQPGQFRAVTIELLDGDYFVVLNFGGQRMSFEFETEGSMTLEVVGDREVYFPISQSQRLGVRLSMDQSGGRGGAVRIRPLAGHRQCDLRLGGFVRHAAQLHPAGAVAGESRRVRR